MTAMEKLTMQDEMEQKIIGYLPKKSRMAVWDAYKSENGYFVFLLEGWEACYDGLKLHILTANTVKDLRHKAKYIQKVS